MSTQERLLSAATALLDQSGPEGVTLRAVGALAGVSHNAPYKHFVDKEALLAALAATELNRHVAEVRRVAKNQADPFNRLRAILSAHVDWAICHPKRFRLIFGAWTRDDDSLHAAAGEAQQTLHEAIADAQCSGALRAGRTAQTAALLMATAHGAVEMFLSGHLATDGKGQSSPGALVDDVLDLLLRSSRSP